MGNLKSIMVVVGLAVLFTLFSSVPVQAQAALTNAAQTAPRAPRLRGTIKDPSGAVMSGVDVAVLQGANVVRAGKTNISGEFSFDLAAGAYQLAVTAPDFKTYTQPIRAVANMPALAITLSVEGITSVVNVNDNIDEPVVDAAVSLDATTITGDKINDLPDDEESLLAYLQALAGGAGNAQLIIDGFEGGRLPTRDQIAQIIIEPNSFNANGTGPRITIVSRQAGPTRWAGNLSYQYRDAALNARNPNSANKPSNHRSVVSLGYNGPVVKGKLGMTFNFSKAQSESGDGSIHAITPAGPVFKSIVSPSTNDNMGFSQNWYFSPKHTMLDSFNYNRSKSLNGGVGNFALEERGYDSYGHGWNAQVSDNKTISSKMTNTFQFQIRRNNSGTTPRTNAVAINVVDAFSSGGSQNESQDKTSNYSVSEILRWTPNTKWNLQFAVNANHQSRFSRSQSNYLGTFTYASLDDYLAQRAVTFTQTSGNPDASFKQSDANTSLQATYRIKATMSLSMGAQYTVQSHLRDYNNISPTMQYQVQVKKRTIISLGVRMSYPNAGFSFGSYEQLLRGDGTTKQFNTVISNPDVLNPLGSLSSATTTGIGSSLQTRDPHLVSPYVINTQASINESLPKNWRVTANFNFNKQVHSLRNRNINAPYPGTPLDPFLTSDQIDSLRPFFPLVSRINQFEATGNSLSKNVNFTVQVPSTKKFLKTQLSGTFQYGLSWAHDDSSAQNPYDLRTDWARNDQRHRLQGIFSIRPPRLGSYSFNINANSGRAYSITTGRDDNRDQSINDRPVGVPRNSLRGPGSYTINLNYSSPPLNFRKKKPVSVAAKPAGPAVPAAAASPIDALIQSARTAGIPEASIQQLIATVAAQPGLLSTLAANAPTEPTTQPTLAHPRTTLNVNVNNLLNNTRINAYSGVLTSPLFGKPTSYGNGRSIQLSLNSSF